VSFILTCRFNKFLSNSVSEEAVNSRSVYQTWYQHNNCRVNAGSSVLFVYTAFIAAGVGLFLNREIVDFTPMHNPRCVLADLHRWAKFGCNRCSYRVFTLFTCHLGMHITCENTTSFTKPEVRSKLQTEEVRATATGNTHKKVRQFGFWDTRADSQTDILIAMGRKVIIYDAWDYYYFHLLFTVLVDKIKQMQ